jgi:hypothetical protein
MPPHPLGSKPAHALQPGDIVELAAGPAEVIGEPFLGQRGASPFDAKQLFVRVRIKPFGRRGVASYATWDVHAQATVRC